MLLICPIREKQPQKASSLPMRLFFTFIGGSDVHFRKKITVYKTITVYQCRVLIESVLKLVVQPMYL